MTTRLHITSMLILVSINAVLASAPSNEVLAQVSPTATATATHAVNNPVRSIGDIAVIPDRLKASSSIDPAKADFSALDQGLPVITADSVLNNSVDWDHQDQGWTRLSFSEAESLDGDGEPLADDAIDNCATPQNGVAECQVATTADQGIPPAGLTYKSVSMGDRDSCAVLQDRSLLCWGGGKTYIPSAGLFESVGVGYERICSLNTKGLIRCWGRGFKPGRIRLLSVAVGYYNVCGIQRDRILICSGPFEITWGVPSGEFLEVSVGYRHACAIRTDNTLACWGLDYYGAAVPPGGEFKAVSSAYYHSCGIRLDGTAACWGDDSYGQSTPPVGTFKAIHAFGTTTCAIRSGGTLVCWGDNRFGQSMSPKGKFRALSDGTRFGGMCAIRIDGTLACWGNVVR